jgi:hypothetical protein
MNAHIPGEYDGAVASFIDGALIAEEIGWDCSGIWHPFAGVVYP